MSNLLDGLNVPIFRSSPSTTLFQGLLQYIAQLQTTISRINRLQDTKPDISQFPTLKPDFIRLLNRKQTLMHQIVNKTINFLPKKIFIPIFMRNLHHLENQTSISNQQLILLILVLLNHIFPPHLMHEFLNSFIQLLRNRLLEQ